MADFKQAYQLVLQNEGGYVNDPNDPGGETYKGVARNIYSKWLGWTLIDLQKRQPNFPANLVNKAELNAEIEQFYRVNYWDKIKGDEIKDQRVANSIFDFAVNAGTTTSSLLAQKVVGVTEVGVLDADSLTAINNQSADQFISAFTLAKIARYISIVKKRPTSHKYFYGWIRRALGDI
ncbi:MAG TPA: glycosyl hydrolase 108 family protein [Bacteroidia bacterium]|nr:glycosyl hydrolase 108 family protein [Bacteroidia bacterium]